jgi:hypothetical protein
MTATFDANEPFGIDLGVAVSELMALSSQEAVRDYVVGFDDLGNRVTKLDIRNTNSKVWLDFVPSGYDFKYIEPEVELAKFVRQTCQLIRDDIFNRREEFEYFNMVETSVDQLKLERIVWDPSLNAWYFMFTACCD